MFQGVPVPGVAMCSVALISLSCVHLPPPSLASSGSARLLTAAYLLICIFNFYLCIVLFKSHFQE